MGAASKEVSISPDELLDIKKKRPLSIITEDDSDTMCSMLEECERESDISTLRQKLYLLTSISMAFSPVLSLS